MKSLIAILALSLSGCASSGITTSSNTQYIRDQQGQTLVRITDSNVYLPNGQRIARIDSSGNVFNTQGQRVVRFSKK